MIRLQKYLASCGVASRRRSEQLILDGKISVNDEIITELGTKVTEEDVVKFNGEIVKVIEDKKYYIINKPEKYICSNYDIKERDRAIDIIPNELQKGLFNVGRLDYMSCGLLIFTNDGDLTKKITHPSYQIEKEYEVETDYDIPLPLLRRFVTGTTIKGIYYQIKDFSMNSPYSANIILTEGKNREIRNLFNNNGLGIRSLKRIRIGNLLLNDLKVGSYREISKDEIYKLLEL